MQIKNTEEVIVIGVKTYTGEISIINALRKYKGIGINFANYLLRYIDVKPNLKLKMVPKSKIDELHAAFKKLYFDLTDEENLFMKNLKSFQVNNPNNLNHYLETNLTMKRRYDINRLKKLHTHKGWCHSIGKKVRNQHTK